MTKLFRIINTKPLTNEKGNLTQDVQAVLVKPGVTHCHPLFTKTPLGGKINAFCILSDVCRSAVREEINLASVSTR